MWNKYFVRLPPPSTQECFSFSSLILRFWILKELTWLAKTAWGIFFFFFYYLSNSSLENRESTFSAWVVLTGIQVAHFFTCCQTMEVWWRAMGKYIEKLCNPNFNFHSMFWNISTSIGACLCWQFCEMKFCFCMVSLSWAISFSSGRMPLNCPCFTYKLKCWPVKHIKWSGSEKALGILRLMAFV